MEGLQIKSDLASEAPGLSRTTPGGDVAVALGPLATAAAATLRAFFDQQGHRPSSAHWTALLKVLETMESMADGTCETRVFLSALDPGVGKTSAVVHFARALLSSKAHRGVGMVVCVGRVAEAQALADQLSDHLDHLSIFVSKVSQRLLTTIGQEDRSGAQLLITTQQMVELASDKMSSFEAVQSLQFKGAPRQVRVWDEAFLPGVAVSLNADDIAFLFKPARKYPEFHRHLRTFCDELEVAESNTLITVPDFEGLYEVTVHDLLARIPGAAGGIRDDQRMAAQGLFSMAGKAARVWRDNMDGSTILTYRDTLPADLAPLLVLDASGSVRGTYADLERHRDLKRLPAARKDYSPLTINVWRRGGGKSAFRQSGDELAEGIAATIMTAPSEQWLLVTHKPERDLKNVETAVKRKLSAEAKANVAYLTWGQHMASNEFAAFPRVILAGTLFMREGYYIALTHLAQDRPTAPGLATPEEVQRTREGEHAHHILQALCRGRVRRSDGDKCLPMGAWVIASAQSRIADQLPTIFPGCVVLPWQPIKKALTGDVTAALTFVRERLASGATKVSYVELQRATGIHSSNFKRDVTSHPEWDEQVAALGLRTYGGAQRVRGLELIAAVRAQGRKQQPPDG